MGTGLLNYIIAGENSARNLWIQEVWKQNLEPTGVMARRRCSLFASLSAEDASLIEDVSLIKDSKLRGHVETGGQGIFSGGAAADLASAPFFG